MRTYLLLATLLGSFFSFAQMRPIGKVYIVEGVVIDRETSKVISSAILYNDSLKLATTSDENGYFKIVVPFELVKDGQLILIDIVKTGYKRNGSGFKFYQNLVDTVQSDADKTEVYGPDVKVFYMAKNSSSLSSTVGANAPAKKGAHGASMVHQTYKEMITEERREEQFDRLKEGNEKVYFQLDGCAGLATRLYDLMVIGKLTHVYIDGRKTRPADINKVVKRSKVFYDGHKSDALSKALGKETIALRTTPPPGLSQERLDAPVKATLEIDLGN